MKKVWLVPLLLAGSACSSAPTMRTFAVATEKLPPTMLVLGYEMRTPDHFTNGSTCDLYLYNRDQDATYRVQITPPQGRLFAQVPAGGSYIERLYCHRGAHWTFFRAPWTRMSIRAGKINHSGKLLLSENEHHDLSAGLQPAGKDDVQFLAHELAASQRGRVIALGPSAK